MIRPSEAVGIFVVKAKSVPGNVKAAYAAGVCVGFLATVLVWHPAPTLQQPEQVVVYRQEYIPDSSPIYVDTHGLNNGRFIWPARTRFVVLAGGYFTSNAVFVAVVPDGSQSPIIEHRKLFEMMLRMPVRPEKDVEVQWFIGSAK